MKLLLIIVATILSVYICLKSYAILRNYRTSYNLSKRIIISITNIIILLLPLLKLFKFENIIVAYFLSYIIIALFMILLKKHIRKSIKKLSPIFAFIFFSFLSVFFAYDSSIALKLFFRVLSYISIIFMILNIYNNYKIKILLLESVKLSSIFLILTGFYQLLNGASDIGLYDIYNPNTNNLRVSMTFNDSLEAAVFTTIVIMVILSQLISRKKNVLLKFIDIMLVILLTFLLLKTGSRTTFISVVLSIFIFYILLKIQDKQKIKFYMKILIISPIILMISFIILTFLLKSDMIQRFLYLENSVNVRKEFWNGAIKIYKENVFGVGLGNFKFYALNYINSSIAVFNFGGNELVTTHAESTYFTLLSEIGLCGLLSYIYILISALVCGIRSYINNKKKLNLNIFPILIITTIIITIINNTTTYFGNSQAYMTLFFMIIGFANDKTCCENISV